MRHGRLQNLVFFACAWVAGFLDPIVGTWERRHSSAGNRATLIVTTDGSWQIREDGVSISASPPGANRVQVLSGPGMAGRTVETHWLDNATAERAWREKDRGIYRTDRLEISASGRVLTVIENWLSPPAEKVRRVKTVWDRVKGP